MSRKEKKVSESTRGRFEFNKQRRKITPELTRPNAKLFVKPSMLIVCEGVQTEPSYFRQFRLTSATIKTLGLGYNTISLVKKARMLASLQHYDQVWCVFDKDDFPDHHFNSAVQMARELGFGVAYSNQAFEYWLLLHFEDHQGGGMHRSGYLKKLNRHLKPFLCNYDESHGKQITDDLFELLLGNDLKNREKTRMDLAIDRAQRIYNCFDHQNPAREVSSTTVFMLVKEILKYV